jgi:hypothetical protein
MRQVVTWQVLEIFKLAGNPTLDRLTDFYPARSAANASQFGMSLYALYASDISASIVVALTILTLVFNLVELMVDGIWPPHRFYRHEIPHVSVSRIVNESSQDIDLERNDASVHEQDNIEDTSRSAIDPVPITPPPPPKAESIPQNKSEIPHEGSPAAGLTHETGEQ